MKHLQPHIILYIMCDDDDQNVITMSHHVANRLFKIKGVPNWSFGNSFRVSNMIYSMTSKSSNIRKDLGWEF
jgi:hypothetical protein